MELERIFESYFVCLVNHWENDFVHATLKKRIPPILHSVPIQLHENVRLTKQCYYENRQLDRAIPRVATVTFVMRMTTK
jgi:hypothetical protein